MNLGDAQIRGAKSALLYLYWMLSSVSKLTSGRFDFLYKESLSYFSSTGIVPITFSNYLKSIFRTGSCPLSTKCLNKWELQSRQL